MSRHPDFKSTEASRPIFEEIPFHYTKTPQADWKPGSGANDSSWKKHGTVEIDPYGEGRASVDNYKLLISGIVPRPIGFVSTVSADGKSTNLAPMSYTQVVNHDPPIFCIGISEGQGNTKDTARNILETKEATINIISEWFAEAANYTSINAPYGVSEWTSSGLTPASTKVVKPARVAESAFTVEAKLVAQHEWHSKASGKRTGMLFILEGVYFHVREDALNAEKNAIDPAILRPVSRLGDISYGRTTQGYQLSRPDYNKEKESGNL